MEDTKLKLTLCLNACLSVFVITLVNLLFLFHLLAFSFILIEKKKKRVLSPPSTVDHGYCPNVSIVVCGGGVVPPPVVSGDTVPPSGSGDTVPPSGSGDTVPPPVVGGAAVSTPVSLVVVGSPSVGGGTTVSGDILS